MGTNTSDVYRPSYNISKDAILRAKQLTILRNDPKADLSAERYIDEAVKEAISTGQYEPILDAVSEGDAREALLVALPRRVGRDLYAVVKDDRLAHRNRGGPTQIVMTILDKQTATHNLHNSKWKHRAEPATPKATKGALMEALSSTGSPSLPPQKPSLGTLAPLLHWKVQYPGNDDLPIEELFTSKEDCVAAVEELFTEGGLSDVKIWREVLRPVWEEVLPKAKVELQEQNTSG